MRQVSLCDSRCVARTAGLLLGLTLLHVVSPAAADGFSQWNYFRTSALQPGDMATVRVENPHGAGLVNTVLHLAGTVQESALTAVLDGPYTLEALLPGPVGQRRHYGFRLLQGSRRDLLPVKLADGTNPVPGELTFLADDPVGDEIFGRTHLDLVECRVSFSSTRLYATLRNVGGGFPVVSGLSFFGYLFALSDPSEDAPDTVWALLYTYTASGIINPGLYRIEGTGLGDLVQIGNITVQEFSGENTIMLSCLLDDLYGDPAFAAWFDPQDPIAAAGAFTQRITLTGGPQEADRIEGGRLHMRGLGSDPGPNTLPELSGFIVSPPGPGAVAEVQYTDSDGHCPVLSEIVVTESGGATSSYPMYPLTLDYGVPVPYRTLAGVPPLVEGNWTSVEARFSDNGVDVVTISMGGSSVEDVRDDRGPGLSLQGAPNPSAGETMLTFRLVEPGPIRLSVHDPSGRGVTVLADGDFRSGLHTRAWDGRDSQGRRSPAGVYLLRLVTQEGTATERITLVR